MPPVVELEASSGVVQLSLQDKGAGEKTVSTNGIDTIANLQVNNHLASESLIKEYLVDRVSSFKGGQIAKWHDITSDTEVLNTVKGQYIQFSSTPPLCFHPKPKVLRTKDSLLIEWEISKLLGKEIVIPSQHEAGEFVSPIFVREK